MTEYFHGFPQFLLAEAMIVPRLGHYRFLPHHLQFIINLTIQCYIVWILKPLLNIQRGQNSYGVPMEYKYTMPPLHTSIWDVTSCSLQNFADVSEELSACIFKVGIMNQISNKQALTFINVYKTTRRHFPYGGTLHSHRCESVVSDVA
jgi:hypothetical protein